jgi:non-ribosomal peptide synthetase component F
MQEFTYPKRKTGYPVIRLNARLSKIRTGQPGQQFSETDRERTRIGAFPIHPEDCLGGIARATHSAPFVPSVTPWIIASVSWALNKASFRPRDAPARSNDYGNSDKKGLSLRSWGDCRIAAIDAALKTEMTMTPTGALYHRAETRPKNVAFIKDKEIWTYERPATEVDCLARGLIEHGVRKGDRVALHMANLPELVVAYHACFKVGAIAAPLNIRLKTAELTPLLQRLRPALLQRARS